jgi:hypothetical protein
MSPTDFYAGAIAAFVVILFTKFFTHRQRQPGFGSGNGQDMAWWIGHWICVSATWLGLLLAIATVDGERQAGASRSEHLRMALNWGNRV